MPTEILMPALSPTMTEGNLAKWLKKEGDDGQVRRRDRRDRDRQGDHGGRGGRRGHAGQDPGAGGHRGRGGQHADRHAAGRRRGRRAAGRRDAADSTTQSAGPPEGAGRGTQRSRTAAGRAAPPAEAPQPPAERREPSLATETDRQATVREALRDAMAEEMRRDDKRVPDGRGGRASTRAPTRSARACSRSSAPRASSTRRSPSTASPASASAPRWPGLRPIVEFMTWNFAMQAIDHIINSAAKTLYMAGGQLGCPIVFRGPNGAAARVAAQHSQEYSTWYAHCPGPEGGRALYRGRRQGPAQGRDPRSQPGRVPRERDALRPELRGAEARRLRRCRSARPRSCATARTSRITAFSLMVDRALKAAEKLAEEGIEAEVIDLRTHPPARHRDHRRQSVKKTNRIVSVEEGWPQCGMGAEIAP